jgi:hypothetical protein
MFTDPIVFTLSGTNHSLARVRLRERAADYQNALATLFMTISHQDAAAPKGETGTHVRSLVKVKQNKLVADVLNAERQEFKALELQLVVSRPQYGFDATELKALWTAFKAEVDDAFMDKIYGQGS